MDSPNENLVPPTTPKLSWRSLQPADVVAITTLAAICLEVDGGHLLGVTDTYIQEHYLPALPGASIGAFMKDGQLIACAAVQPTHTAEEYRTPIVSQVHPAYRRRGLGTFLLKWCVAKAAKLLSECPPDRRRVLQITTESLTDAGAQLFERYGFTQQFVEDVMRRDLRAPIPDVLLPSGISLATWMPALADQFFAVYQAAFQERPGYPGWSQEEWMAWLDTDDDDFQPEISLLARHDDFPIGFVVCADRWVVQMGVRPDWRERGIGSALLIEALRRFREAGWDHVLLDVNANNPRAAGVYTRLMFERVGRRARFVQVLT
ncbi:MAG: GNAT family N-acetyltransferase [Anaerolineales bacterium]